MQLQAAHAEEITKLVKYVDMNMQTDCQNTPTQHRLSSVTDSCMPEDRSTERNKKNEGQHSGENERWHGKRMCGQLPHNLDEKLMDIEQSYH